MENQKYLDDLKDIKDIMHKSSRFISLSGMSGVLAGLIALCGVYLAYKTVYSGQDYFDYRAVSITAGMSLRLLAIATGVLILAILSGIVFTARKARKQGQKLWNSQHRRLIINFAIPLISGGILCLILLSKGFIGLVAPLTLIFYGMALLHASKYTLNDIRILGILEIALGLMATYFIGYGLVFWAIGFGIAHIVYGIYMHIKYGS